MITSNLSCLEEIPDLKTVWQHEAADFTPWLAENIDFLGEALSLDLELIDTEVAAGDFKLDILAKNTADESHVIIENQLTVSDHGHLGKLLTYATAHNAMAVIWIVQSARPEHSATMTWLNEKVNGVDFYLCEMKLFKIGDSLPAPKIEIISAPNAWAKPGSSETALNPALLWDYEYWSAFTEFVKTDPVFVAALHIPKPQKKPWLYFSLGNSQANLAARVSPQQKQIGVVLQVKNDSDVFRLLEQNRSNIEGELQIQLSWNFNSAKKSSTISISKDVSSTENSDWNNHFAWMRDMLIKFRNVFTAYLQVTPEGE